MKTENIRKLLVRFYNGETSEEDEILLTDFFRQQNPLPPEFAADRKLFLSLAECEKEVPAGLEEGLDAFIDRLEKRESATKHLPQKRYSWKRIAGVAASLLLIAAIGIRQYTANKKDSVLADTFQSPEEAKEATLKALHLFSQSFAKGIKPVSKADNELKKTQEIINQTLYNTVK